MADAALDAAAVRFIRRAVNMSDRELAQRFGVSRPTIRKARTGASYGWVEVAPRATPGAGGEKFRRRS